MIGMEKKAFMQALRRGLARLPEEERLRALAFYEEAIDDRMEDGMTEAEAVAAMGSPEDIVREALGQAEAEPRPAGRAPGKDVRLWSCAAEGIREVTLAELNRDVKVLPAAQGDLRLEYEEAPDEDMEISAEDGALRIRRRGRERLCWAWRRHKAATVLRLPEGLAANLTAIAENGDVCAEGLSLAGSATLRTKNGDVCAKRLAAGNALLASLNGDVELKAARVGAAVLSDKNGDISAEDVRCASLRAEDAKGDVELKDVAVEGDVFARTTMGDVAFDRLSAGARIELHSMMGDVAGTFLGPRSRYAVSAATKLGDIDLPRHTDGEVPLVLSTEMGDIHIGFEDE